MHVWVALKAGILALFKTSEPIPLNPVVAEGLLTDPPPPEPLEPFEERMLALLREEVKRIESAGVAFWWWDKVATSVSPALQAELNYITALKRLGHTDPPENRYSCLCGAFEAGSLEAILRHREAKHGGIGVGAVEDGGSMPQVYWAK